MAFFGSSWNDDIDLDNIGPFSHWNDDIDDDLVNDYYD